MSYIYDTLAAIIVKIFEPKFIMLFLGLIARLNKFVNEQNRSKGVVGGGR